MENEKDEKQSEVIDLSKFDFSKNSSEAQNKQPKSLGHFLSAISEGLFQSDSPEDKKKKTRNLIIIIVNFALMFIILGYYFGFGSNDEESYNIEALPAEMITGEEI